ncbi:MAG: hypothetical protein JWR33_918 [Naasia sp.]|jgi:hypothetical protein|uniref:hypothetical protein n=1 Tax=Naasia sp. TaxID=2546198 RepID=UPI0026187F98|nr:hypothetical protein [Naasia sp.]MCU1570177.1 hypothetical protein [Naasia sp.]
MNDPGLDLTALVAPLIASDHDLRWIDTASDPLAVDEIGRAISDSVQSARPDAVACWVGDDESVLAHTVARALRVPVIRAEEDMGLLTLEPNLGDSVHSVLMLATSWSRRCPPGPLYSMLTERGKSVTAVLSLLPGASKPEIIPEEVPYTILARG